MNKQNVFKSYILPSFIGCAIGGLLTLPILVLVPLVAAATSVMLYKKIPYRIMATVSAAMFTVGLYVVICLPGILEGTGPHGTLLQEMTKVAAWAKEGFELAGQTDSIALVDEWLSVVSALLPEIIVAAIIAFGMVMGGLSTIFSRALAKTFKADLRPIAPFPRWSAGKGFMMGACILFGGALLLEIIGKSFSTAVYFAVQPVVFIPIVLQGAAFFDYMGAVKGRKKSMRIFFLVIGIVFLPITSSILVMLGLIEQLLQMRRRIDMSPKRPKL